jgi:alanine racemase
MTEMFRRTFAEINLNNLLENYEQLLQLAGPDRFHCPMVKANGYGHGDVQIALCLERHGVSHFGVCLIEEGLLLRSHGLKSDVLVFRGFDRYGAQKIVDHQMIPVVSTWEHIEALESCVDDFIKVHVKFNTGMSRLGFDPSEAEALYKRFAKSKKLKLKAILSHFYSGEDAHLEDGDSARQAFRLRELLDFFKPLGVYAHLLNSAGIASFAKVKRNGISNHYLQSTPWGFRPGLMLYGYQPDSLFTEVPLKPVMTLKSVVNNIRRVRRGEAVSYGATWKAARDSWIAVVPIGYADGVHRLLSNRIDVLFAGRRAPLVGRVCMDFLMLDVTEIVGDQNPHDFHLEEVILFGFDSSGSFLSAELMARAADTITWEVLTSVGERVPRLFRGGEQ